MLHLSATTPKPSPSTDHPSGGAASKPASAVTKEAKEERGADGSSARPLEVSNPPRQQPADAAGTTWKVLRRERSVGQRWGRTFLLPENVDVDKVSVNLERGVLTVRIPLCPPPPKIAPRRIAVQGN